MTNEDILGNLKTVNEDLEYISEEVDNLFQKYSTVDIMADSFRTPFDDSEIGEQMNKLFDLKFIIDVKIRSLNKYHK